MTETSPKELALQAVEQLPDDATLEDAMERLYLLERLNVAARTFGLAGRFRTRTFNADLVCGGSAGEDFLGRQAVDDLEIFTPTLAGRLRTTVPSSRTGSLKRSMPPNSRSRTVSPSRISTP